MGFQDDELLSLDQPADASQEQLKKTKITYTRNFLLSLSDLELCKQLPSGFDKSVLSEFQDAFHGSQEKARVSGSFATHSFRHTEYSASPPTRRDANSYSQGSARKSESRSRDNDSQSDRDSESVRQFESHSRRPWQNSEHDGLLGSGSSPKLTGYTPGTSVPKLRVTDQNLLSRSNAPYQPPRPYKAVPQNRSATSDLHNDETFGSSEMTSDDRTEEERKRRAEFELMRKERHKSGQSNQSSGPASSKDDLVPDSVEFNGNLIDEKKTLSEVNESCLSHNVLVPHSGSTKPSPSLQIPTARPVVPPGFVPPGFGNSNVLGKSTFKPDAKVETSEINTNLVHGTLNSSVEKTSGDKTFKQPDDQSRLNINSHAGGFDLLTNGKGLDSIKGTMQHDAAVSNQNFSTPLLEDIFGNTLTANGGDLSILTEAMDKRKGSAVESSKFAHWFVDDGGKGLDDGGLSEKPIDLFSLMGGAPTSKVNPVNQKTTRSADTTVPVLTCEDLEQSILSESSHHELPSETRLQGSERHDVNALASQHLLSVLKKGPGLNDIDQSLNLNKGLTSIDIAAHSLEQQKVDKVSVLGKNPTLEAIFGSAFMKELQASDAPVSTKRDSNSGADSSRSRVPENKINGGDRLNPSKSFDAHDDAVNHSGYAPSNLSLGNPGRFGALSSMFRDVRSGRQSQDNQMTPHAMDYNSRSHSSPPQLATQYTNPGLPMFNQQEAHRHSPQMKFPDNMIRHQMVNHPMMQHVRMQVNAPPSHLIRQYSGNVPQPPHPYNQLHGFSQELNPQQGFHIGHQQPSSIRSAGMPIPDIDSGNRHSELVQRLMDMELRSNKKQNHPLAGHLGRLPNM